MAATSAPGTLVPDLEAARALASGGTVVPIVHRYVEDSETPVSAFLKLRGEGPAFLLESRRGPLVPTRSSLHPGFCSLGAASCSSGDEDATPRSRRPAARCG